MDKFLLPGKSYSGIRIFSDFQPAKIGTPLQNVLNEFENKKNNNYNNIQRACLFYVNSHVIALLNLGDIINGLPVPLHCLRPGADLVIWGP